MYFSLDNDGIEWKKQGCVQGYQSRVRVGGVNDRKGLTIAIEKKTEHHFVQKRGRTEYFLFILMPFLTD